VRLETERGRRLDRAFGALAGRLDSRDRSFAHELAFGVTRMRGRLDHLLEKHVARGLASMDPTVHEILRLGAYQLLYMGSVPDYAAVSESVDQVRAAVGKRPAGFVNAVLRKVERAGGGVENFPDPMRQPRDFLATWGSHPEWLVDRWLARWGVGDTARLVEADNQRPSTCLVFLEGTPADAVQKLAAVEIGAEEVGMGSACVRLEKSGDVEAALAALPASIVQDPAANLVSCYADVPSGTIVADLCAAPGGKILALSDRPQQILTADRSESRIRMVRENVRRTGRDVALVVADALYPPIDGVDVILLDVPCTGTGTLARHPDARWRLHEESIRDMTRLQSGMLDAAADRVVPGGLLVYSTCSLEPEENEERVETFLGLHPAFSVEATDAVPSDYLDERGCLSIAPHQTGFDGSFAARLRRAS